MFYLLKKITLAVLESYKIFKKTSRPTLFMTLLVKNEEDILEENLRFHKAMGVDAFIVTDNNSTDRTTEIIKKYQKLGWIKEVIHETGVNYKQKRWVDRMIWTAKRKYHADWVINADADELWYSPTWDLKKEIRDIRYNVLNCNVINVYPEEDLPFWEWNQVVNYIEHPEKYDLSEWSIYKRHYKKVMMKTAGYIQISMGNHKVAMFPKSKENSPIRIYHYPVRSRKHFTEKMANGGKQLEENKSKHVGRHWRHFYKLYKSGMLDAEYERVIGRNVYDKLYKEGIIKTDNSIKDFFQEKVHMV